MARIPGWLGMTSTTYRSAARSVIIGRAWGGPPVIPYNIIADFAGGGLHAATAILAAIIARGHTGRGQYVDVAMSDGVAYMLASMMSAYFSDGVDGRRRAQ